MKRRKKLKNDKKMKKKLLNVIRFIKIYLKVSAAIVIGWLFVVQHSHKIVQFALPITQYIFFIQWVVIVLSCTYYSIWSLVHTGWVRPRFRNLLERRKFICLKISTRMPFFLHIFTSEIRKFNCIRNLLVLVLGNIKQKNKNN